MTAKGLKNALLQEAVQGKLVPQDKSEGNAKDLLEEIRREKARLVREGKIKKEKTLPEIAEDEIPFDIPESWCWCRLGEIFSAMSGLGYKKDTLSEKSSKMIRVLRGGNILDTSYVFRDDDIIISDKYVKTELFLKKNYLITPAVTSLEHIGKIGYVEKDYEDVVVGGFVLMLIPYYSFETLSKFCLYLFGTRWFRDTCKEITHKSGQAFYNLSREKLLSLVIPLPPLAEQKRIVAALEKFMPLVEEYGKKETELKTLNQSIGTLTKKAILQEAVQGKLVPQVASEGNAKDLLEEIRMEKVRLVKEGKIKKEKMLPEIAEDEIPFEIPDSWCWCRFGDVFRHNTGKTQNSSVETKNGTVRKFITTSNLYWNEFDFTKVKEMLFSENELSRCTVTKGDLLICEGGEYGRSAIWKYDYDVCFQNHIHRVRAIRERTVVMEFYYYLMFFLKSTGLIEGRGVGIKSLSTENLHQLLIPLPPLAEQKRIAAAIEKILPLCEKLGE